MSITISDVVVTPQALPLKKTLPLVAGCDQSLSRQSGGSHRLGRQLHLRVDI